MERIICFGDSITSGRNFPEGRRWTALVQNELDKIAPGKFEVYNRGVGGNTTQDGIARFDADVLPLLPSLVLIEFGFNDSRIVPGRSIPRCNLFTFTENLREITRMIRSKKGKPVLLTNHPIAKKRASVQGSGRKNFVSYQTAIRDAAKMLRLPLVDLETEMLESGVKVDDLVCEDGVHLSTDGNRIYASFVLNGLRPLLRLK